MRHVLRHTALVHDPATARIIIIFARNYHRLLPLRRCIRTRSPTPTSRSITTILGALLLVKSNAVGNPQLLDVGRNDISPGFVAMIYFAYSTINRQAISRRTRPSQLMATPEPFVEAPPGALLVGGATAPCVGPPTEVG